MRVKRVLSPLLVAVLIGGGLASTAMAAGEKAADPRVAQTQQMIDAAVKAAKKAASVDSQWRDTGKFIKQAQAALKTGDFDKAMKLAKKAEIEGNLGYEQGASQKKLRIPTYLVYATKTESAPSAVVKAGSAGKAAMASAMGKITPALSSLDVIHNGQPVTIYRTSDRNAVIPAAYAHTGRHCPPLCVQPIQVAAGVDTLGELEVLDYLERVSNGDLTVMVVDSRAPEWIPRGTIPGSVNIPWNKINTDTQGSFAQAAEADTLSDILHDQFHARLVNGKWDFRNAKTLVMYCNGSWCPQSSINIKTLLKLGYPPYKLKWYRGGMQSWVSVGLTTVHY